MSPTDLLVKEFVGYLATERGLAPRTIVGYERVVRRFLLDSAPTRLRRTAASQISTPGT